MYTALRATSLTLAGYLNGRFLADAALRALFNPALGGMMQVSLNTPEEMATNNLQGLSLWLYRVVRDEQRLNAPPERIALDRLLATTLPVRLHYLATPLVTVNAAAPGVSPEQEQAILGKVLQSFNDHATLRGADLLDDLTGTSVELHVRLETLTFEEITKVWYALQQSYQLSVSYEVSVVPIATALEPYHVSPVEVALPDYAVIVSSEET